MTTNISMTAKKYKKNEKLSVICVINKCYINNEQHRKINTNKTTSVE